MGSRLGWAVVVMWMVVSGGVVAEAAITCGEVTTKLSPCIGYLKGGGVVPPSCCGGIKALIGEAKTTADRQAACNCVKSAAAAIPGINFGYASSLAGKCGVTLPFKVGPNVDCSKIQ